MASVVILLSPSKSLSDEIAAYRKAHVLHVTSNAAEARAALLLRGRTSVLVDDIKNVDVDQVR
jgi:hypothetical protein